MTEEYKVDINSSNHADIWDDSILIKAYNESLQLGKEQVAKTIARATNNRQQLHQQSESESSLASDREQINNGINAQQSSTSFKVSDYVRVTYDDGIDYEARIIRIDPNDDTCLIKYLGYDNEQVVNRSILLPSWGKKARKKQICAAVDNTGELLTDENDATSAAAAGCSGALRNKKKSAKRVRKHHGKFFDRNREHNNSFTLQTPPMPPMLEDLVADGDSEHLSAMLMSWYMSGYYTGLYQGRKQTLSAMKTKQEQQHPNQNHSK